MYGDIYTGGPRVTAADDTRPVHFDLCIKGQTWNQMSSDVLETPIFGCNGQNPLAQCNCRKWKCERLEVKKKKTISFLQQFWNIPQSHGKQIKKANLFFSHWAPCSCIFKAHMEIKHHCTMSSQSPTSTEVCIRCSLWQSAFSLPSSQSVHRGPLRLRREH